jgi:hypothetical protein
VVKQCRLSVFRRGIRLADYLPDWYQQVELPDGGAVHPQGSKPRRDEVFDGNGDQIVIIGSALAQTAIRD